MAKFGIMMIREYQRVINSIYNEALASVRAKINVQEIEKKAWEILGRPDLYDKRRDLEKELTKIEEEELTIVAGSCTGEETLFEKAKREARDETTRLAWEEVGRIDLYNREKELEEKIQNLQEELQSVTYEQMAYKTPKNAYGTRDRVWDRAYDKYLKTLDERTWAKVGNVSLPKKKKELQEKLAKVADEEKHYNGQRCELKRQLSSNMYTAPRYRAAESPLDDARWQAKELLYPEATELQEMVKHAEQNLILAGATENVTAVIDGFKEAVAGIVK